MLTETATPIHPPGEAVWGVGQPSPPGGPRAGGFPTQEEIEQVQLRKLRSLLEAILPSNSFYARKLAACTPALAPASLTAPDPHAWMEAGQGTDMGPLSPSDGERGPLGRVRGHRQAHPVASGLDL